MISVQRSSPYLKATFYSDNFMKIVHKHSSSDIELGATRRWSNYMTGSGSMSGAADCITKQFTFS